MNAFAGFLLLVGVLVATAGSIPAGTCPPAAEENPAAPVHLPHQTDCTKFYKCFQGVPCEMQCPAGLHWNAGRDYCDYPAEANCVVGRLLLVPIPLQV